MTILSLTPSWWKHLTSASEAIAGEREAARGGPARWRDMTPGEIRRLEKMKREMWGVKA